VHKSEQYWASSRTEQLHDSPVKIRDLTAEQILAVPCDTCGAAVGEVCALNTGVPRTEPHRDRKLSAADVLEKQPGKNIHRRAT